ncbi:hypothetical protein ACLOJK_021457 [Asimina triloba]
MNDMSKFWVEFGVITSCIKSFGHVSGIEEKELALETFDSQEKPQGIENVDGTLKMPLMLRSIFKGLEMLLRLQKQFL